MIAGKLTETITIVKSITVKDNYGATSTNWVDSITTRASVKQNSGSKSVINNEIFTSYTVEFGIRYYHTVNEFDRIKWRGNTYVIESIVPDRLKNHTTIITSLLNE